MRPLSLLLSAALLLAGTPAFAQWMWLDKDGRKVFSDRAPPPEFRQPDGRRESAAGRRSGSAGRSSSRGQRRSSWSKFPSPRSARCRPKACRSGWKPRHAKAALSMRINKTDRNDAAGLAQIMRTGWYREAHVKSGPSHLARALLASRALLVGMRGDIANQIRGLLAEYGIVIGLGMRCLRHHLPEILEEAENRLQEDFRLLLTGLRDDLVYRRCDADDRFGGR